MKYYRSGASILFEKLLKTRLMFYGKNDSIINKNVSRFNLSKVARNNFLSMSNQGKTAIKMYDCRSHVVKSNYNRL